jgi:hypothetical protein
VKWKSSDPDRWCFENLETPIDEVDDTLLPWIVAKVFGTNATRNNVLVENWDGWRLYYFKVKSICGNSKKF